MFWFVISCFPKGDEEMHQLGHVVFHNENHFMNYYDMILLLNEINTKTATQVQL